MTSSTLNMAFVTPTGAQIDVNAHVSQYVRGQAYDLNEKLFAKVVKTKQLKL